MARYSVERNGPGIRILDADTTWWGPGYCGICGTRKEEHLIPRTVRWWDCDDGWRMGILCSYCHEETVDRGPQPDDYAVVTANEEDIPREERMDILMDVDGDADAIYSDLEQ